MGLYLRNNRYYFKKQIDGQVYYKALKLRRGQEGLLSARLKQIEENIIADHFGLPRLMPGTILFSELKKKYLEEKKHKKSIDRDTQRLSIISELWGDLPVNLINKSHIKRLEDHLLSSGLKTSTVNRYFEILRNMFNLAIEENYLKENPCRYYQRFTENGHSRALKRDELIQIFQAAKALQSKPKSYIQFIIYDLILFALNTGMRLSEILNVKKSYIYNDVISYPITQTKYKTRSTYQSSKVKVIALNSMALSIIDKHKYNKDDYLFPVKWRNPNVIYDVIRKIRELSSVKDFTFHQLRHTVSTWLSSQVSLTTAKTVLGHADIKTTLKYFHVTDEQRQGVAKIEQFVSELTG